MSPSNKNFIIICDDVIVLRCLKNNVTHKWSKSSEEECELLRDDECMSCHQMSSSHPTDSN